MLIWSENKSVYDVCVLEHGVKSFFFFFMVKILIRLPVLHEKGPEVCLGRLYKTS